MTTGNIKKPITIFPDIPREIPLVDESKMLTDPWKFFFDQLSAALQINLKPEGFVIPQQSTTNMNLLTAEQSFRNIIYNSTVNSFYGNLQEPASGSNTAQVWLRFAMLTTFAGNPNGNVAASLYWFCWDTSDLALYICTTAGNVASAVWTAV